MPFKPSLRPHPFQTQLRITWHATLKQQAAKDIQRCIYKCNIPFHVIDTLAWKAMINFVVKIGVDDFHGSSQEALQTNLLHDEIQNIIIDLEHLKQS